MKTMKVAVIICILTVLSLVVIGLRGPAPDGALLFKKERCIYCHRFKGQGATIGPDLTDVTRRRSDDWIRDQIREPHLHNRESGMPSHEYLSGTEISAILTYLKR
jgi:mono/diheme cytochrome c family protein